MQGVKQCSCRAVKLFLSERFISITKDEKKISATVPNCITSLSLPPSSENKYSTRFKISYQLHYCCYLLDRIQIAFYAHAMCLHFKNYF